MTVPGNSVAQQPDDYRKDRLNHYLFITNPAAGKGEGRRIARWLEKELRQSGLKYDMVETNRRGDATTYAENSAADIVVAVGGDGTVNEVVNGLVHSGKHLGIIPAGSGNDLIKSLGIPRSHQDAFDALREGKPRSIDVGTLECTCTLMEKEDRGNESPKGRYFANGMGIGFDAAVAKHASQIRWLSGTVLYLSAVLLTVREYRPPMFDIVSEGQRSHERCLLIAIGNGSCAGGGFYLTPNARVDDGNLDMCVIHQRSLLGVLALIPRVLKGKHINTDGVWSVRGKAFVISSHEPFPVHTDGEIVADRATAVRVGIREQALRVIVPG